MGKIRRRRATAVMAGVLLVGALGFIADFYMIGEPVDGEQVYCTASVNGQSLDLRVEAVEPGTALRGWRYERDGGIFCISARKVPVSLFFNREFYETSISIRGIEKVLFGNKVIWSGSR